MIKNLLTEIKNQLNDNAFLFTPDEIHTLVVFYHAGIGTIPLKLYVVSDENKVYGFINNTGLKFVLLDGGNRDSKFISRDNNGVIYNDSDSKDLLSAVNQNIEDFLNRKYI